MGFFFEHVFAQMPFMSGPIRKGWENYIRDLYEKSPIMRYYDEKYENWHSRELVKLVRNGKEANKPKQ